MSDRINISNDGKDCVGKKGHSIIQAAHPGSAITRSLSRAAAAGFVR